ncbi:MAG: hypothetical protein RIB03_09275 [Henriciella sp.]|uniref:hypothetical protein n=1 Tax=Henriciella sp. TaxID=1968823 RepID=UPI00260246FB|nr:hypothetical protein [Henriciella sp.]
MQEENGVYCETGDYQLSNGRKHSVRFAMPADCSRPPYQDHFALFGAVAAFVLDEDYHQTAPADAELIDRLQEVFAIWRSWYPYKRIPKLDLPRRNRQDEAQLSATKGRKACLFTGGVDSLFTLLQRRDCIDSILSVIHEDNPPRPFAEDRNALVSVDAFAARMDLSHFTVRTNMMTAIPEYHDAWAHLSHGAAYAATAHFLSGELDHATISSSLTWSQLMPWGSHPDTDWRFGTSLLSIDHFGTDTSRIDKTAAIAKVPEFLEVLNVCSRGRYALGEHINCSHCQKCLRTMLALDLAGVDRKKATAFNWSGYSPANVSKIYLRTENEYMLFEEIRDRAVSLGRTDIVEPVTRLIRRSRKFVKLTQAEMAVRKRLPSVARRRASALALRNGVYKLLGLRTRLNT